MNGINIITANFSNGGRQCVTRKLFQYDYGQKVQIKGLNLPQSFQVHISNTNNPLSSSSIFLGRNNEIEIPDEFLISGTLETSTYSRLNGKTVKLQGYTSTGYPAESGDSIAGYWLVVS